MDPLKFQVDSLDNVPENLQGFYQEQDGGGFKLAVEGVEIGDQGKKAIEREREAARRANQKAAEAQKTIDAWKALGRTPEEINEILEREAELEEEAAKKRGDFEALRKQDQDKFTAKEAEWEKEREALISSERDAIVKYQLQTALVKADFTDTGLEFIPKVVTDRVKVETVDGKRQIRIYQPDGATPMAGTAEDGTATFDDLAKDLATRYPDLVKAEMRPGGDKDPKPARGGKGKTIARADFDKLSHPDRMKHINDGYTVV